MLLGKEAPPQHKERPLQQQHKEEPPQHKEALVENPAIGTTSWENAASVEDGLKL